MARDKGVCRGLEAHDMMTEVGVVGRRVRPGREWKRLERAIRASAGIWTANDMLAEAENW